ncbi:FG-GAP-like repeat-containing protein [uncultured Thiothrix sp.]|uniref:FG-GAP-like repeat-containing protein n=1 Tax=uncultured Thiothrix sp. TaxID=223185 RepID=UPI0026319A68|nr:FG-GAP-like repeat-containing protein [uncultured Thiothrix sp.]HMT92091.1 M12 family metallo-peptidase [Thiolinea sp.]
MSFAKSLLRLMFWALAVNLISKPLFAVEVLNFNQANLASALYQAEQAQLLASPLDPSKTANLQLTRFHAFTSDTKITVKSKTGTQSLALPQTHYFYGAITDQANSSAFMAVDADGKTRSIVQLDGQIYVSEHSKAQTKEFKARALAPEQDFKQKDFSCGVDGTNKFKPPLPAGVKAKLSSPHRAELGNGISYSADLIIETDYEFYTLFNSASAAAQYVVDLIAYVSSIYEAEIKTSLRLKEIVLYTSPADPWDALSTDSALYELQAYYLTKRASVPRTTVHLLSGKDTMNGGIAFIASVCTAPAYAGASQGSYDYGVSGGMSGSFTPNSPLIVWDAYVVAHELGHNFGSSHTHAYDVDHGYNLPVDCCYATAGGACQNYQPATNLPGLGSLTGGSTATHPGTIMSYCHLVSGGSQNLSMSFGTNHPYGIEASRVPEQMRHTVESYATSYPQCLVPKTVSPTEFGFASVSKWYESFVAQQAIPFIGDFNGDNLDDVASFAQYSSHKVFVALSTGTSLAPKTLWKTQFALGNEEAAVGDFNGDGKTDLVSLTHNHLRQIYVALSNGTSFDAPSLWFSLKTAQDGIPLVGDFNGDGKDDMATIKRGKRLILVNLSSGNAFGTQNQWSSELPSNVQQIVVGDFNGDKQADLGFSFSNGELKVSLSTGASFTTTTVWHSTLATGVSQLVAGDFNADGKDDIASYLPTETGGIYLALAEDGKFGTNQKAHAWFSPYDQIIKAGRFTSDNASDVISFTRGSTADVWVATDLKQ